MRKLAADLVREITTTIGSGNVTLTALTGWVRVDDRYAVNDRVPYSIFDANGNKEVGLGTNLGTHVVARTTIYGTLVAGVWTSGGAAMALSGSAVFSAVANEYLLQQLLKVELVLVSANSAIADGFSYGVQASGITLTLPASPQVNDRIEIFQATAGVTGVIVNPNGSKFNGQLGNMTIDVAEFSLALVYVSAAYGWKVEA